MCSNMGGGGGRCSFRTMRDSCSAVCAISLGRKRLNLSDPKRKLDDVTELAL